MTDTMTDHPIRPTIVNGLPLCSAECPLLHPGDLSLVVITGSGCCLTHQPVDPGSSLCLPRVRELVAVSQRRCDGCRHWERYGVLSRGTCAAWVGASLADEDESCSRWEAKK
jgi:hypothetical protein